jgi:ribosomal-protein-alanine N-acetyltransferase
MYIETPRLIVRDLQPADIASLAALWADPNVTAFMGGPRNENDVLRSLEEDVKTLPQADFDLRPVIERASGEIIGHCGLLETHYRTFFRVTTCRRVGSGRNATGNDLSSLRR